MAVPFLSESSIAVIIASMTKALYATYVSGICQARNEWFQEGKLLLPDAVILCNDMLLYQGEDERYGIIDPIERKRNMAQQTARILIVDDDTEIRELLEERLNGHEFSATAVPDGAAMLRELKTRKYDLIILDIMLPGEDGLALCRRLRTPDSGFEAIPIIFVTALGETTDRVVGLELGGDDYLPKPFQTRELVARIRAVLRRSGSAATDTGKSDKPDARDEENVEAIWRFEDWRLDTFAHTLIDSADKVIPLSAAEYRLLLFFLKKPGRVLSRDQIMDHMAGRSADVFDRSIDVQVSRLRTKLRDNGKNPRIIRTMRGDGYMLAVPVERKR